jgi:hypothetical protein
MLVVVRFVETAGPEDDRREVLSHKVASFEASSSLLTRPMTGDYMVCGGNDQLHIGEVTHDIDDNVLRFQVSAGTMSTAKGANELAVKLAGSFDAKLWTVGLVILAPTGEP